MKDQGKKQAELLEENSRLRFKIQELAQVIEKSIPREDLEELQQREEHMRLMLRSIGDAVIATDRKGQVIQMNPAAEAMTGWSVDEALGKPLAAVFHIVNATTRTIVENPVDRVIETGHVVDLANHTMLIARDGAEYQIMDSAAPIRNDYGEVRGVILVFSDVTEKYAIQESLRKSEEKYRLVVDNANDVIWTFDLESMSFTYVSPSTTRIFGYTPEQAMQRTLDDACPPETIKQLWDNFGKLRTGRIRGDRLVMEVSHYTVTGDTRLLELSATPIKNKEGVVVGFSGVSRDITDRKRAEREREEALQALRLSEERYRSAFHTSPDALSIVRTADGLYFDVNEGFSTLTGYSREEVLGETTAELKIWHDPADRERLYSILAAEGSVTNMEALFRTKDGSIKTGLLSAGFLEIDGEPHIQVITRDITEEKQLEAQRETERKERLDLERRLLHAQKLESIGTLAGGIAHDFNNLLMGIQGCASLMLLDLDPAHPHYRRLKHIEEQVASGATLTGQLLGFARGGRYEIRPTSINEIVEKTADMFGRAKKEVSIHKKLSLHCRPVEIDRTQMEQVFMNLYVNAWQAMPKGGDLFLETANVVLDARQTAPFQIEPGRYVKISVMDTGIGMDEKTRERIFDPFFSTKAMGRGAGLGLATVYGIVRGHKGMISVYSEPDRGTSFSIYLPALDQVAIEKEARVQQPILLRGVETIMLVDDEDVVLDVSRELLESLGYRVYTAGGGREALELYKEKKDAIDLVILDMIMPCISGSIAFDRLKEMNPGVRVLLSSGYSINSEAKEILDRGCSGFLQKPFHLSLLSRKIREILDAEANVM